ncbi:MAG: 30S ribosomal protein S3 [Gammaproteobacteria bacterium]|nr:30S ribosomal protein S3 [Gammaproteobacteria bacterium]
MGQKVNPVGIRLGFIKNWQSRWYANKQNFSKMIYTDYQIRDFLKTSLANAGISKIEIERAAKNVKVVIYAARPGVIIGKSGKDVEKIRNALKNIVGAPVQLVIEEVRKPELDAQLVADGIASQLVRRVAFRRAMKQALNNSIRAGAKGVKICVSGRLGGIEIARSEWAKQGRIPLHTFRADIDYALSEAKTNYGIVGVKVWIFKGEVLATENKKNNTQTTKEVH